MASKEKIERRRARARAVVKNKHKRVYEPQRRRLFLDFPPQTIWPGFFAAMVNGVVRPGGRK